MYLFAYLFAYLFVYLFIALYIDHLQTVNDGFGQPPTKTQLVVELRDGPLVLLASKLSQQFGSAQVKQLLFHDCLC